jgi:hypothetical protein
VAYPGTLTYRPRVELTYGGIAMLKVPPPVWALVYVLLALVISWQLDWPKMPGFPLPLLGIVLVGRFQSSNHIVALQRA